MGLVLPKIEQHWVSKYWKLNSWKVIFSLVKLYNWSRQLLLSKYVMYVMCRHVFFPMAIYVVPKYWNYTQMAHLYFFMLCLSRISLEFCVKNQFGNYIYVSSNLVFSRTHNYVPLCSPQSQTHTSLNFNLVDIWVPNIIF